MLIQLGFLGLGMLLTAAMFTIGYLFRAPRPKLIGKCYSNPTERGHVYSEHETARNGGVPRCLWCGRIKLEGDLDQ